LLDLPEALWKRKLERWNRWLRILNLLRGLGLFSEIFEDRDATESFSDSLQFGLVILWLSTAFFFVRAPWRAQNPPLPNAKGIWGGVGILMVLYLFFGIGYLAYEKWGSKKHRAAISSQSPDYPSFVNTLNTFFDVQNVSPNKKCLVRLTAPPENRELLSVLKSMAEHFCEIQPGRDPAAPSEDILKDSKDDFIVVHMAKESATLDPSPRETTIMVELGNFYDVSRTYQMPQGSPPGLIWLQIGRGFPYKRKD